MVIEERRSARRQITRGYMQLSLTMLVYTKEGFDAGQSLAGAGVYNHVDRHVGEPVGEERARRRGDEKGRQGDAVTGDPVMWYELRRCAAESHWRRQRRDDNEPRQRSER